MHTFAIVFYRGYANALDELLRKNYITYVENIATFGPTGKTTGPTLKSNHHNYFHSNNSSQTKQKAVSNRRQPQTEGGLTYGRWPHTRKAASQTDGRLTYGRQPLTRKAASDRRRPHMEGGLTRKAAQMEWKHLIRLKDVNIQVSQAKIKYQDYGKGWLNFSEELSGIF